MHRTFRLPWMLLGGLVVLLLGILPSPALAQTCSPEHRPLIVLVNGTTRLQMSSKRAIRTVVNPKEGLLTIRTLENDPTTVLLVGTTPGITRIELTDTDGNREFRDILIQADVEYLTAQLNRALPLSNIQVIPNGLNSVILTGFVSRAEDIPLAQNIAQSLSFQALSTGLRLSGVQQVQLDVVIARVNRDKRREFGFNFLGNARQTIFGSSIGDIVPVAQQAVGVPSPTVQPSQFGQVLNSLPGTGNVFGGVISNAAGFIGFLRALEREGLAKLMAQPRLMAKSGNPASLIDGGEQAIPVPAGLGQVGVQFEPFGTRLNFLPLVLGNGRIHLDVEPEVSNLDPAAGTRILGTDVPGRVTQRVRTSVELETGQTFVIGGLIQRTIRATADKYPVLGQLPLLGALFSTKFHEEIETELVILVTPHLVDAQSACQVSKVLPGQETRTPDDYELFLEGILEAPRGPRAVLHGNRYVPAHFNGPSAKLFPCAGAGDGLHSQPASTGMGWMPHGKGHGHTGPGCANGNCGTPAPEHATVPYTGVPSMPGTQPAHPGPMTSPEAIPPVGQPQPMPATEGLPINPVPGPVPGTTPAPSPGVGQATPGQPEVIKPTSTDQPTQNEPAVTIPASPAQPSETGPQVDLPVQGVPSPPPTDEGSN